MKLRSKQTLLALGALAFATHCGGLEETTPDVDATPETGEVGSDATVDSGSADTGSPETGADTAVDTAEDSALADTGADSGVDSTATDSVPEGALDVGDTGECGVLYSSDLYVDASTTKPGIGTAACPFSSIRAALAFPLMLPAYDAGVGGPGILRTVHVAAGTYAETDKVVVPILVSVVGAGPTTTKIVASGACEGGDSCVVELSVGDQSRLEGFTLAGAHTGFVSKTSTFWRAPVVKNVVVTGVVDGGRVLGDVTLDTLDLHGNSGWGLRVERVCSIQGSRISGNASGGVRVEAGGALTAQTTSIESNGKGLVVTGSANLSECRVEKNGTTSAPADGINVGASASLSLRKTSVLGNTHNGLTVTFGTSSRTIDLGSGSSPGLNVFSSATASSRNAHSALCFESVDGGTTYMGMVNVEGNSWAACSSTTPVVAETAITGDCASVSTQVELAYQTPNIVARTARITPTTGCTVGP